jgi:hypothetical protein
MAIMGHSPFCVATHPSDMAVALTALGARVRVAGPDGGRWAEMPGPHRLPDGRPDLDTVLALARSQFIGGTGIGEIGITGTAAAIGNAVYHATGRRGRDLPITPAKLLRPG